ncbi:MAG TPA: LLM class flavin-dependent oxidoreductase [Candidatus Binataceae bacterium]|jgi:alkanesulfonate monooxygenase SsuD/methylene tetrahydromethanopterin reductase-like flavin-dependent oxidoreductase (luciferase family)|nr:LLM class flavin-dependent oxidoreductase [Candidatus Binataceae bacterium]
MGLCKPAHRSLLPQHFSEHHFSEYGFCASPALTLAAVAPVTNNIRLGTGITVLPLNHPLRLAEEIALLDLISDGRGDFGVGRGFQPIEYRGFHVDQSHSHENAVMRAPMPTGAAPSCG